MTGPPKPRFYECTTFHSMQMACKAHQDSSNRLSLLVTDNKIFSFLQECRKMNDTYPILGCDDFGYCIIAKHPFLYIVNRYISLLDSKAYLIAPTCLVLCPLSSFDHPVSVGHYFFAHIVLKSAIRCFS